MDRTQKLQQPGGTAMRAARLVGLAVLAWAFALAAPSAHAEIFRCKLPSGASVYQEVACPAGQEVVTDAPFVRERQQRALSEKKYQEKQKLEELELKKRLDDLRRCRSADGGCSVGGFYLRALNKGQLTDALGMPDSTQKLGTNEYWYYMVWLTDLNGQARQRRVQVTFIGAEVDATNIY